MKKSILLLCFISLLLIVLRCPARAAEAPPQYRPPAVPLVACNPLFSIWSDSDHLADDVTRHWTKKPQRLTSMIRIDGKPFRLMGDRPASVPALPQVGYATVLPTRTIYQFQNDSIQLTLTFFTPALPTDVAVLSRPLTYLTWTARSMDGKPHAASLFFSASSELAVDHASQQVAWKRATIPGLIALRTGTVSQAYVERTGDDSRIDWGYAYIATDDIGAKGAIASQKSCFDAFAHDGSLPQDDTDMPRAVEKQTPTLALSIDFGSIGETPSERRAMIAYDDIYAVSFFGRKEPGFWRHGDTPDGEHLLTVADQQYPDLLKRAQQFDAELMRDCETMGGPDYAYICSLAYRQSLAGCGIAADANGQPQMFTKENGSDGNMGTVDVLFPMSPICVLLSPTLAKATLAPVLVYASSPEWKLAYAPHDLGEYPDCFSRASNNGTKDDSEAMPVEESGNLIILADAIAHCDGNTKFLDPWWSTISRWVEYLQKFGPDPEEQLCTDDFNGRLAHNSNLAVKAIVGLGAYADLCRIRGDQSAYDHYISLAREDARHWMQAAGDGDHYRLAYDKPGTWSQVYNLVWDKILNLNVFPAEVYQKEVSHYLNQLEPYGLPLDSRHFVTKTDWTLWTASLASNKSDFQTMIVPLINYLQHTPDRVPFVDGYDTDMLQDHDLFHARPVIGGVFVYMLTDPAMWKKWSSMDQEVVGTYAPLPTPPVLKPVVPTMAQWKYTTAKPADDWMQPNFNDSKWKNGGGGFGRGDTGAHPHTTWDTDDIWIRRSVHVPAGNYTNLRFHTWHDEDIQVYVNGVLAATADGFSTAYVTLPINEEGKAALKLGATNELAVHCHQTVGGQYIDLGIVDVVDPGEPATAQHH